MNQNREQVHEALQMAQEAVRQAQREPDEALNPLQKAYETLQQAYQYAENYADPSGLQQIQDAENAIEQALRSVKQTDQSPVQAHNAIEQALRACQQIRSLTD